CARKQANFDSW
nr:immunoglobulin heavy chain junction region [Macaca mulatta]MOV51751.1 immunoglobulin heavy chain junction region [Macaca mulatta]